MKLTTFTCNGCGHQDRVKHWDLPPLPNGWMQTSADECDAGAPFNFGLLCDKCVEAVHLVLDYRRKLTDASLVKPEKQ